MVKDISGFWKLTKGISFTKQVLEVLPATCDRFNESRYFIKLLSELQEIEENLTEANWIISGHLAAVISILDAAEVDFDSAGRKWGKEIDIANENFLRSDTEISFDRDPLAINQAYRDIRNLRVHYAIPVVCLGKNKLLELSGFTGISETWYFCKIYYKKHQKLRSRKKMGNNEIHNFNNYIQQKPLITLASHHLYILYRAICDTANNYLI